MQVTHEVAATLYERASAYVRERSFSHALDLFCGVGGFSLSIAPFVRRVSGIEVSPMAVESARNAAARLGYGHVSFYADDVELFLSKKFSEQVDLIIVNPPRRGLSEAICSELLRLRPSSIIYSSCAPETFARDLHYLSRSYTVTLIAPFDMFPMTEHCEVFGILELM
jgi:23S rRNA (uracil747-C5)-methyltransferase